MKALVDNDVLFKGACYQLLAELVSAACPGKDAVGVLGSAPFVIRKKLAGRGLRRGKTAALKTLSDFLTQAKTIEPAEEEQKLAADLEFLAQRIGVSLDAGESQLCAVLTRRLLPLLLTGDKRAIVGLDGLLEANAPIEHICGRVRCLEQAFLRAMESSGSHVLRQAVCSEPDVDKALTICFSCHSGEKASEEDHRQGLESYIRSIRSAAARVLST